ncbi:MAG TPA: NAD-dependent epimerase/dehydratase family protein [Myxococcota bacterium]|nr:NAD-dependent epimerase/dehydratase family protein [Myxococcota bacterium]
MNVPGPPKSPVLVTGAGGFIGSTLCRALVEAGCEVRGLDLPGTGSRGLEKIGVRLFEGDICRPDSLAEPFTGVATVFHLAALARDWGKRSLFMAINAGGTKNALDAAAAAGVRRFAHMSSLAIHSFSGHHDADESTPAGNHINGYCSSKIAAEKIVQDAQAAGKFETTIIRPGAIIHGPGDTTAFTQLAAFLEKSKMMLVGGGCQLTCYSYAENLVRGMIMAAASPAGAGETFILTDDLRISVRDYMTAVCRALGLPAEFTSIPAPLARAGGWTFEMLWKLAGAKNPPIVHRYRVGLVARDFHFCCEKAKRVLGYSPKIPFEEGLASTARWYLDRRRG